MCVGLCVRACVRACDFGTANSNGNRLKGGQQQQVPLLHMSTVIVSKPTGSNESTM